MKSPQALFTVTTPDYFRTLRVPVVRGRDFSDGDRLDAPLAATINEQLAKDAFPGVDPIGPTIRSGLDLVLREGALLVVIGLVAGAALSYAGAHFISGLLFGVSARDPLVFAAVAGIVSAAALAGACLIPGRRALKVDPLLALRAE